MTLPAAFAFVCLGLVILVLFLVIGALAIAADIADEKRRQAERVLDALERE